MDFATKILNQIFGSGNHSETFTFKGKATTDPFEISELGIGWQMGYDYTLEHYKNFRYDGPWPEGWGNGFGVSGFRGNGWAEGCVSGRSFIDGRDYPGLISMRRRSDNKVVLHFKDGKIIIV